MTGRPIPGFYWDPEKKKYFRIQANHVAPAGSLYSREAVKRRKLDSEKRHRQAAFDRRVRRERVQRSRCMDYAATRLAHEVGSTPVPGFVRKSQCGRVYVSQLQRHTICNFDYYGVSDFARHGPSGTLVAGICMTSLTRTSMYPPLTESTSADVWKYDIDQNVATYFMSYELSSLSMCDSGFLLTTYIDGLLGGSVAQLGRLPDLNSPSREQSWRNSWLSLPTAATMAMEVTFWCSAARPNGTSETAFAVGTSEGLQTVRVNTTGTIDTNHVLQKRSKDILAVEWLSETVIASGFRDSSLFLSDLRSNDSIQRIKHPGMIGQIRKFDDYRMVVAGNRSLHMYDLRYPKTEIKTSSKKHGRGRGVPSTRPYLVFDNYTCEIHHSMDINKELGLLASATQDRQNICFYSLADGSIVPSPTSSLATTTDQNENISRIRFEEYQYPIHHRQAPRLLYSRGAEIIELAW